ncbi:MAG: hypothetical protein OMOMHJEC_03293 [Xanthomonadales bacterium]|nr:hypothetical protein [Xanthomonadales bacterium]
MVHHIRVFGPIIREVYDAGQPIVSRWGGPGIYASLSASCFGRVSLYSVVGPEFDGWGDLGSVDCSGVRVCPGWKTPTAYFRPDGSFALEQITVPPLDVHLMPFAGSTVLSSMHPKWLAAALRSCAGSIVVLDSCGGWIEAFPREVMHAASLANVVSLTSHEWMLWDRSIGRRPRCIRIEKRGADGVFVQDGSRVIGVPAPLCSRVISTIGCGDMLLGVLGARLCGNTELSAENVAAACVDATQVIGHWLQARDVSDFLASSGLVRAD